MRTPLQVQRSVPARPALRLVTNQSPQVRGCALANQRVPGKASGLDRRRVAEIRARIPPTLNIIRAGSGVHCDSTESTPEIAFSEFAESASSHQDPDSVVREQARASMLENGNRVGTDRPANPVIGQRNAVRPFAAASGGTRMTRSRAALCHGLCFPSSTGLSASLARRG